ncbi:MAG: hypothetical protein M3O70_22385 [Actinomycetota bacterium]|nr:hypothetical protein [Actinomycetota bacterium]
MPCIFCIAVFALLAGALTSARIDQLEQDLIDQAVGEVRRTVESSTTTAWELDVAPPVGVTPSSGTPSVPVTVTVYKPYARVRIQLRAHSLTAAEVVAVQDQLAARLGLEIVGRSDEAQEAPVRAAVEEAQRAGQATAVATPEERQQRRRR